MKQLSILTVTALAAGLLLIPAGIAQEKEKAPEVKTPSRQASPNEDEPPRQAARGEGRLSPEQRGKAAEEARKRAMQNRGRPSCGAGSPRGGAPRR